MPGLVELLDSTVIIATPVIVQISAINWYRDHFSSATIMSDAATKTIYCIRHGESTFNEWRKSSLWNPRSVDAPLSAKGKKQVRLPPSGIVLIRPK
jgi:hypothetical protein